MVDKIESIENEMMGDKNWQMTGEVSSKQRPVNSLLDEVLDFNSATKLPPQITKETTSAIESLIKQRILDELFDDPIRKYASKRDRLAADAGDNEMDFTKSKKGLGELYEDDLTQKLIQMNPEAFLDSESGGPDAALKREIEDTAKDLFHNLSALSNIHFTARAAKTEAQIKTQNVPSLMLEEAIPIGVATGKTKSAREALTVDRHALRDRSELTKEERRSERARKKRQIKASNKAKQT